MTGPRWGLRSRHSRWSREEAPCRNPPRSTTRPRPEAPPTLWLDAGPGMGEKVFTHLDRHLISEQVELADRTRDFAQVHLCGPEARAVLEGALGGPVGELGELRHEERPLGAAGAVQ